MKKLVSSCLALCSIWSAFPTIAAAQMMVAPVVENIVGATMEFGQVTVGSSGQTVIGGVNNTPYVLSVYAALGGPDAQHFSITNGCSGIPLNPGASCTGVVTFNPLSLGPKKAELILVLRGTQEAPAPMDVVTSLGYAPATTQFLHLESRTLSGTGK